MPSHPDAPPSPASPAPAHLPRPAALEPAVQLALASRALWAATLSLMTAFMQTQAPAHRQLLARRIGRNFDTLARQDCFDTASRASFGRLSLRWQARAEQSAADGDSPRAGFLRALF